MAHHSTGVWVVKQERAASTHHLDHRAEISHQLLRCENYTVAPHEGTSPTVHPTIYAGWPTCACRWQLWVLTDSLPTGNWQLATGNCPNSVRLEACCTNPNRETVITRRRVLRPFAPQLPSCNAGIVREGRTVAFRTAPTLRLRSVL